MNIMPILFRLNILYYTENLGAVSSNRTISPEVINITSSIERKQLLVSEKITYGCWNKLYRHSIIELANEKIFHCHNTYLGLLKYAQNLMIYVNSETILNTDPFSLLI